MGLGVAPDQPSQDRRADHCHPVYSRLRRGSFLPRHPVLSFQMGKFGDNNNNDNTTPLMATNIIQYTKEELSLRMAIFYSGSLVSGAFGNLIAAGILNGLAGARGYSAWQWLYIMEGAITIFFGGLVCLVLPDFPDTWKKLSEDERRVATRRLAIEASEADVDEAGGMSQLRGIKLALTDPKTYLLALAYHGQTGAGQYHSSPAIDPRLSWNTLGPVAGLTTHQLAYKTTSPRSQKPSSRIASMPSYCVLRLISSWSYTHLCTAECRTSWLRGFGFSPTQFQSQLWASSVGCLHSLLRPFILVQTDWVSHSFYDN
jgi:MFS family permease